MKTKLFWLTLTVTPVLMTFISCKDDVENPDVTPEETQEEVTKTMDDYFDFSTTQAVTLNVNYGRMSARALVQVYAEDPFHTTVDEAGNICVTELDTTMEPIFKGFLDNYGTSRFTVQAPAYAQTLYVYSDNQSSPVLIEAKVKNGVASANYGNEIYTKAGLTRGESGEPVTDNPTVDPIDEGLNVYALVRGENDLNTHFTARTSSSTYEFYKNWIEDPNNLLQYLDADHYEVSAQTMSDINAMLRNDLPASERDNSQYAEGITTADINARIDNYIGPDGVAVNVESTQLWLTFLSEHATTYTNTLGYYFYKSDEAPADPSQLKKYIILPNVNSTANAPYYFDEFTQSCSPIPGNTQVKIQLLYFDEEGHASLDFPKGYTVGFFEWTNAYNDAVNDESQSAYYKTEAKMLYSDREWNENEKANFIALSDEKTGTIVYGIEDGGNKSYDDVLFAITASVPGSIDNDKRPDIDPATVFSTTTTTRCYGFEDNWPSRGDYDMNDVMVENRQETTFNGYNQITRIVNTFTVYQKDDAALKTNAFAVTFAEGQTGTLSFEGDIEVEPTTGAVFLTKNTNKSREQSFKVTRTFTPSSDLMVSTVKEADPFIVPDFTALNAVRKEVHLPKAAGTALLDKTLVGTDADAWFVDVDGKHPFAVSVPTTRQIFLPVDEKVVIGSNSSNYPNFDRWVEDQYGDKTGAYNKWYLQKVQ